jgi:hypothetical protein
MAKIIITGLLTALLTTGCVAMYAPIVWNHRAQVNDIVDTEPLLSALYKKYDPQRETLRGPNGYDEQAFPSEAALRLASYNPLTKIIYINREFAFTDNQLKEVLVHEFCHHIWDNGLDKSVQSSWNEYLKQHPSPLQRLVGLYYPPGRQEIENFAFTIEFPRKEDIKELVTLSILNESEAEAVLAKMAAEPRHDYWGIGMFDRVKEKNR